MVYDQAQAAPRIGTLITEVLTHLGLRRAVLVVMAAARRGEAATWRDQLDAQWARANELDPDSQTPDGPKSTEPQTHCRGVFR